MYIEEAEDPGATSNTKTNSGRVGVLFLAIIFLGVYPAPLLDAIQHATDAIRSSSNAVGLVQSVN